MTASPTGTSCWTCSRNTTRRSILCGHGHANHDFVFEGVPGVMGRSNLRVRAPVGGFNLVEIKDGKS